MKRLWTAIIVVFVALGGVIGWWAVKPSDEPVYEGRTLTNWLRHYWEPTGPNSRVAAVNPQAVEAVDRIGTNAIPTLLRLLRDKYYPLRIKANSDADRQELAGLGFQLLGTNAQTAVPALIHIASRSVSITSKVAAIGCLGYVGPAAKQAVPYLSEWVTNEDADVRTEARLLLLRIDPEAAAKAGITNAP